jgi:Tfp pilus assembly protein PilF
MLRKYDQAQDSVAKAISLVSDRERENYYFLWKYQSVIFVELYKYEEAIRSIDLAIELAPNDPLLPIQKAQILSDSGKYSEAIALSDKIIEDNKAAYAYYSRGLIKFGSGDAKGAVVDLIQATKINPNFVESYAALGIAKATLKDYRGALANGDRAIKINPRNAFAHIVRCTANSKLGHFQDALTDSDRAIKFIQINDLDRVVIRTNVMFFALFQIQHCRNLAQSGLGDK